MGRGLWGSTCSLSRLATGVGLAAIAVGCSRSSGDKAAPPAASSASLPVVDAAAPVPAAVRPDVVQKAVNPKGRAPYAGPTGSVRGVVRVSGDKAPMRDDVLAKIKDKCADSRAFYGPVFREGPERALADAFVTVTGYDGYLPARGEATRAEMNACAFGSRTYGVMFGQRLDVYNLDSVPYMPKLLGAPGVAVLVALPKGEGIKLHPHQPGRFALVDEMSSGPFADVMVVKFPTFDVTGLDGRFEITGVPVGEVDVSAHLPATLGFAKAKVTVKADEPSEVTLTVTYTRQEAKTPDAKPKTASPEVR